MNYKKTLKMLEEYGLVDQRGLACSAHSSTQTINYFVLFSTIETVNQSYLPMSMVLSICGERLNISKAGLFGNFKEHFGYIDLRRLTLVRTTVRGMTSIYEFDLDLEDGQKTTFLLNNSDVSESAKRRARTLVYAIKLFKQNPKI